MDQPPSGYAEATGYVIDQARSGPARARATADGGAAVDLVTLEHLRVMLATTDPSLGVCLRAEAGESALIEALCLMSIRREVVRAGGAWWKVARVGMIDGPDGRCEIDVVLGAVGRAL